jgi:predicted transcriptional regulator
MMGLAAKSSTEGYYFAESGLALSFTELLLQLALAFTQLAKTRLTKKQLSLLFSARQTLEYHPHLSPTGLADHLARKSRMPLSTTKFNLRVLKTAGLLEAKRTQTLRTTARLSFGGQLLTHLLPFSDMDWKKAEQS